MQGPTLAAAEGRTQQCITWLHRARLQTRRQALTDQLPGPDHVVRQSVPEDNGLDLLQAGHQELRQSVGYLGAKSYFTLQLVLAHHRDIFRLSVRRKRHHPAPAAYPRRNPTSFSRKIIDS